MRIKDVFRKALTAAFVSLAGATSTFVAEAAANGDTMLFGIVPQQSATRLAQVWVPLFQRLSQDTGLKIRFTTTKDIPTFEQCLARGAYEFAYMNPYHYVVFSKAPGYAAFAKQKDKMLRGIIVVRKESAAQSLKDLSGRKFAFPSPAAFGASVLPRAEMRKSGIAHHPTYVRSHDSVYRSVAAGLFPAGGGVGRTFANADKAVRERLRILYRTEKYTPHAFARSPKVSPAAAKRVLDAMIAIGETAPELLKPLGFKGFVAAQSADWNDVRRLNLSQSETEIRREGETVCRSD